MTNKTEVEQRLETIINSAEEMKKSGELWREFTEVIVEKEDLDPEVEEKMIEIAERAEVTSLNLQKNIAALMKNLSDFDEKMYLN